MPLPSLKNQTWIPAKNCGNDRGGDGNDRRGREFMKSRKTGIIVSICVVVGALAYLALGNFWDNLVYFCTPSEVKAFAPDCQKKVRVGGMVVKGTVKAYQDQDQVGLTFKLTDGEATIPVTFEGIPPDLFKKGQGAVVEGYWTFTSNLIMAKLALGNFGDNLVYFCTPSEVKAFAPNCYQKKVRVAGMVVKGSVKAHQDKDQVGLTFELTDGEATIPVTFKGTPPDLFKEGQGAVVEGYWTFTSNLIMAKHSEDYMPIELKRAGVELPRKDFMKSLVP